MKEVSEIVRRCEAIIVRLCPVQERDKWRAYVAKEIEDEMRRREWIEFIQCVDVLGLAIEERMQLLIGGK